MLGGNDVGPRGTIQLFFVACILLLSAIINANIFGNMAVLIQSYNKKGGKFQEKVEYATETMNHLKVSNEIRDSVKKYLNYTHNTADQHNDLELFLKMLSPSLVQQISRHMCYEAMIQNDVFMNQPDLIDKLLKDLKMVKYLPEDIIIQQGDHQSKGFYFLSSGEMLVTVTDELKVERPTRTLNEGSYFGEVSMIKNCKCTASVTSRNFSTCAHIAPETFLELLKQYPSIKQAIEDRIRNVYDDRWKKFMKRSLKNIDYFSLGIGDKLIEEMTYVMDTININEGEYVFKAGQPCKHVYIISNGEVDIFMNNNNKEHFIDTLYVG
jgi:CRP-like cAMP-binding protein